METITTKQRIINESLKLFSKAGYDGVSMRDIASAVGIKGASIYNHFKGKEDIFQAIFDEMTLRYQDFAKHMAIPNNNSQASIDVYANASLAVLQQMAKTLFEYFACDEFTVMFRHMIISEQHKSSLAKKYLQDYYLNAPIEFQTNIFKGLQAQGCFKDYDPKIMALHFYSPIYLVLCNYDLNKNFDTSLNLLQNHVKCFCELYK